MKKSLVIIGIAGIFTVFGSCKRHEGCNFSEKAWVEDYSLPGSDDDTCGVVFRLEDGVKLEPINLPSFPHLNYNEGDLVWISWKETEGVSTCGLGPIVKIRCVEARPY